MDDTVSSIFFTSRFSLSRTIAALYWVLCLQSSSSQLFFHWLALAEALIGIPRVDGCTTSSFSTYAGSISKLSLTRCLQPFSKSKKIYRPALEDCAEAVVGFCPCFSSPKLDVGAPIAEGSGSPCFGTCAESLLNSSFLNQVSNFFTNFQFSFFSSHAARYCWYVPC